jgi:maleylpyruvate isomerase
LYGFFRSGTSHRLRVALNLKGLRYEQIAIDLRHDENLGKEYAAINPQRLVPALDIDGKILTQTPAIIEWLEERYPAPPLLPNVPEARAHVRALAAIIGCDIHPMNNKRILAMLRRGFGADEEAVNAWCVTWVEAGFSAYQALIARAGGTGRFSFGDAPTLADVYLIPQVESASRFNIDTTRWAKLSAIYAECMALDAFQRAAPFRLTLSEHAAVALEALKLSPSTFPARLLNKGLGKQRRES